jgi:hypothetical protein
MKKLIYSILILATIAGVTLYTVNSKDNYDASKYFAKATNGLKINSTLDLKLPDQFEKTVTLKDSTKKLIFAFSKNTGHITREFFKKQPKNYLDSKNALFAADVSKMPVFIRNTFAMPDFKKSPYHILLIYEKKAAQELEQGLDKDKVIVVELNNKKVVKVNYASNEEELKELLK